MRPAKQIPSDLPDHLAIRDGGQHDLTVGDLRNSQYRRPIRGVRSRADPGKSLFERSLAASPLLRRGDRFSHASALVLYGCPLRVAPDEPVHIESLYGTGILRTQGLRGHTWRENKAGEKWTLRLGSNEVAVVDPARAAVQAARLPDFRETVVALDHLCRPLDRGRRPLLDRDRLLTVAARVPGRAGFRLRLAASESRVGSESRMETLLRLAAVRAGVRSLTLQHDVRDPDGRFIGRFDLAHPPSKSIFEYDGDQHRTSRRQYLRDLARLERVRGLGWTVTRFRIEDFGFGQDSAQAFHEIGRRIRAEVTSEHSTVPGFLADLLDEHPAGPRVSALPAVPGMAVVSDFGS
ncbi:hypothetical protein [Leucobacter luti]|uniref:hypothetical protein n=1 Tax=Leucobacter luti TaxID=340320 RepID=UPI003D07E9C9